jgi:hypothetical protein
MSLVKWEDDQGKEMVTHTSLSRSSCKASLKLCDLRPAWPLPDEEGFCK